MKSSDTCRACSSKKYPSKYNLFCRNCLETASKDKTFNARLRAVKDYLINRQREGM